MKVGLYAITLTIFLVSCTKSGITQQELSALYKNYIVENKLESQDRIRSFRYHGWQSLDNETLIITATQSKTYLVTLKSSCFDLRNSHAIVIHKSSSNTLDARFDSIATPKFARQKCLIKAIYKITKEQAKEIHSLGKSE